MKAYIAAPWDSKEAARRIRDHLHDLGVGCTATWFDDGEEYHDDPAKARSEAERDLEELTDADFVIAYLPEDNTSRGGMDFELGFAYQYRYPIVLIGRRRNVFHYLLDMRHFESIKDWQAHRSIFRG